MIIFTYNKLTIKHSHMNIKLSPSEIQVLKYALVDFKANLVGADTQYSIATSLLHTIVEKEAKKANRTPKVIPNKQWMFNFTTGGWNTVYAKTKRGAIAQAAREYKTSKLIPNPTTFWICKS